MSGPRAVIRPASAGVTPEGLVGLLDACRAADGVPPFEHMLPGTAAFRFGAWDGPRLTGYAALHLGDTDWELSLAVHPDDRRQGTGARLLDHALAAAPTGTTLSAWTTSQGDATDRLAYRADAVLVRRIFRLGVPLPLPPEVVAASRAPAGYRFSTFTPSDAREVVEVNNAAFSWHPEQGGMSLQQFEERTRAAWFDPEGFLLLRDGHGAPAGFCWTKLHPGSPWEGPDGEIFVICTAPGHQSRGLGRVLTVAGLDHLAQSTTHGMLYVEETNLVARRLYRRIGFRLDRADARYLRG